MNNNEIEKYLNTFLKDIDCLSKFDKLIDQDNLFDILKISQAEIRHSNALAWLLDPRKSKDVGKYFLRKIFIFIMDHAENINVADLIVDDLNDIEVRREWMHTDLLVIIRNKGKANFVICIENKVKSKQGLKQLEDYRKCIESANELKPAVDKNRVAYLFLRVKNEFPNDLNWIEIDYNIIGNILKDSLKFCTMSKELNFFITQYLSTLRKNGMMDDQELQDLAQKIYNQHKKALDYIYDNAQNEDALIFDKYHDWLEKKSDFIKREKKASSYLQFATKELYSIAFKGLNVKEKDLVQYCYYEVQKRFMNEIKLVLHIDSSLPKEIQERLSSIRTKLVKKTDAEWQWTSACKTKIKTDSYFNKHDFYEEKFDEGLNKLLDTALNECQSKILSILTP